MNYSEILHALKNASLFNINRLRVAMNTLLEDPEKLLAIKRQLHMGMDISYFCSRSNKLVDAVIEEIRRTSVCARDKSDGKQWVVSFYLINLANINTDIHIKDNQGKLNRNQFQVGENVSFVGRDNQEMYGTIIQLNPKTATISARDGSRWRVSYSFLFKILDAYGHETSAREMIDVTISEA
jgi:hypothetical protein